MANVLAFAEARGGELRKVAFEAITLAQTLAGADGEVHAILVGAPGIGAKAESLGAYGAAAVFVTEHDAFANYNPEATAALVGERARSGGYRAVVFSASAQGKDLAPRVAAKLRVPVAMDVTAAAFEGDALVVRHPMYIGKTVATARLVATPAIVSLRPGALAPASSEKVARVEKAPPVGDPSTSRVLVTETIRGDAKKLDLGEAPVIISGGRGLKAAEHF